MTTHTHYCPECRAENKPDFPCENPECKIPDGKIYPCVDHIWNHVIFLGTTPDAAKEAYELGQRLRLSPKQDCAAYVSDWVSTHLVSKTVSFWEGSRLHLRIAMLLAKCGYPLEAKRIGEFVAGIDSLTLRDWLSLCTLALDFIHDPDLASTYIAGAAKAAKNPCLSPEEAKDIGYIGLMEHKMLVLSERQPPPAPDASD